MSSKKNLINEENKRGVILQRTEGMVPEISGCYKGYRYYITFMFPGYRCAYIELNKGDKWFGVNYDYIPIDVHGGLTYGEHHLFSSGQLDDKYFIGWDYAHIDDGYDFKTAMKYFSNQKDTLTEIKQNRQRFKDSYNPSINDIIWLSKFQQHSKGNVLNDCKKAIDQIVALN